MGRLARFIPENKDGVLVEVTCRTIGGKALLTPGPNPFKLNELIAGVFGRTLEVSPLQICSAICVSNHYHALLVARALQQRRFGATSSTPTNAAMNTEALHRHCVLEPGARPAPARRRRQWLRRVAL